MNQKTDLTEQYDRIYRYCYFKVHNRETAEDITQETFLRYLEHYADRGSEWDLKYLYRIAHNLCVDEYRKPTLEPLAEENPGDKHVGFGIDGQEAVKYRSVQQSLVRNMSEHDHSEKTISSIWLKNALNKLPDEEQEILLLRYANEVPNSVICEMLQISRFALYRKMQKALQKLQKELGEES